MSEGAMVLFVCAVLLLAGLAVIWMAMQSRRQVREMEHRERLAMIERGLVPSPELDPAAFEAHLGSRTRESQRSRAPAPPGS